ncbi:MAG TPA: RHS repeat-associated core domain-containing protein [Actinomycetota bacterium]
MPAIGHLSPNSTTTVDINPARITTFAGNGTNATVDNANGLNASFKDMAGAVVVGNYAYVSTAGAIRKVDLTSSQVTTLAGSATQSGCVENNDPTLVRFSLNIGQITSDGTYLYTADPGCTNRIWRTDLTGATSTVVNLGGSPVWNSLTYAGGFLYVSGGSGILKVDLSSSTWTTLASVNAYAVAADGTYLWATAQILCGPCLTQIDQIDPSTGQVIATFQAPNGGSMTGTGQLLTAGDYLYSEAFGDTGIERITKANGTVVQIAGTTTAGYVDPGTGTDAWFSKVTGLTSDGTNLWVADSGNYRFRKAVDDNPLPASLSPNAGLTRNIYPGRATTFAGNGTNATVDNANGLNASFKDMGGTVVVGGYAYVSTTGAIRKVDLTSSQVTTLAGSPDLTGCVASTDPSAVRFSTNVGQLDSDGYYLYTADPGCDNTIWRTSIATGATSKVVGLGCCSTWKSLSYAPTGFLYVGGGSGILKVDPINGTWSTYVSINAYAVAADDTYLWATEEILCGSPCHTGVDRINLTTGEILKYSNPDFTSMTGSGQLVSAGQYLYTESYLDTGVVRITKVNGAVGTLVGGSSGQAEGEWSNAKFSRVTGVAFDGNSLWIADSTNHRFSKAVFVPLQAQEMGAVSSGDASAPHAVVGDPVDTNPGSGAFLWSATDAVLPTPGLLPFTFTRYYNSRNPDIWNSGLAGALGVGWRDSFDGSVEIQQGVNALVTMPNGQGLAFTWNIQSSTWDAEPGVYDTLVPTPNNTYTVTQPDGTKYLFEESIYVGWMFRLKSITDRDGNVQAITYNPDQTIQQVTAGTQTMSFSYSPQGVQLTLPDGRYVFYTVDSADLLTSMRDLNGNVWTYEYLARRLYQIKNPASELVVRILYWDDGRVSSQQDGNLPATTYGYSACGTNCTRVTDGRLHSTDYHYDITDGRAILSSVTDQDGLTTSFGNPDADNNPRNVTDPRNNLWQYIYDAGNGSVTSVTSPASSGNASYVYNEHAETTQMTDARGNLTRWVYGPSGDLTCEILPPSSATTCTADPSHTISYTEYGTGQVHTVTAPPNNDAGTQGTTTYTYYADGMVQDITRPGPAVGTTTLTKYSDVSFDSLCQCQTVTMVTPQGNANNCGASCAAYTWTYTYDNIGHLTKVTDPLGHQTQYGFDTSGRLQTSTDARLKVTRFYYRSGTTLIQTVEAPYASGSIATTTYFYDYDGNLQCRILPAATGRTACTSDPSHTVSYLYKDDNRLLSVTDPDGQTWSYDYSSWETLGQITENIPGGSVTRTYDGDNRLTNVDHSDATPDVSYSYSNWISQGKVGMTDGVPGGALVYTHNALDQLTLVKRGTAAGFSYVYFPDGSIKSRTYPDNTATSYTYFLDGSLRTVVSGGKTTSFTYDVANAKVAKTLPNSIVATSTLDTGGRLVSLTNKKNATTYSSFTVTPDEVGNPATVVASVKDAGTGTLKTETQTYTYDDGERLQQVCYLPGCSGTGVAGYSWTSDGVGNRLTQQVYGSAPAATYYKYDGANHLCWAGPTSGSTCGTVPPGNTQYTYNTRGDMTAAGSVIYGYDLADRLTSEVNGSTTDAYTYDGTGNRQTDLHNGSTTTTYAWDPNASVPLLATDSDSSTRDYIYGDGPISEKVGTARYYYSTDAFGSVANVTDASAGGKWSYWYDPWGGTRSSSQGSSPPTNFFQFDSEYHDTTGAYNLRARIYQPGLGVFQQADPASGDHVGYQYASGRPTVLSDPSGLFSWGKVLDWFNEYLNPAYGYLQACFGSDGSGSIGSWAGGCALGSAGLAVTAVALAGPVTRLTTNLVGRFGAAESGGVSIASGAGGESASMSVVRTIGRGEKIADIVNEGKILTYETGNEHALVKLASGERAIVSGGPGGIDFAEGEVTRIFGHTHPYQFPATGPSSADFQMLDYFGQRSSWILEHGDLYRYFAGS